jgi:hypothetical protein
VGDSITIAGASFICPSESVYVITGSIPIDANGNTVAFGANNQAGYRLQFFSKVNRGLRYPLAQGQTVDFRLRSQISAPGHTFEYVGSGTNYNALPWRGGIPIRANERVEENNGRIFSSNTNEIGDFKVGDAFSVDGTTGSVTINTDQFNLSGLNFIGPFSRNGGFSTVGVQLQEVSNDPNLISSTGTPDGNTVPTQLAVKTYTDTNHHKCGRRRHHSPGGLHRRGDRHGHHRPSGLHRHCSSQHTRSESELHRRGDHQPRCLP